MSRANATELVECDGCGCDTFVVYRDPGTTDLRIDCDACAQVLSATAFLSVVA